MKTKVKVNVTTLLTDNYDQSLVYNLARRWFSGSLKLRERKKIGHIKDPAPVLNT